MNGEEQEREKVFGRKRGVQMRRHGALLEALLPRYRYTPPQGEDPFWAAATPLVLEIGFGTGDVLLDQARRHPERRFIGADLFLDGVVLLVRAMEAEGIGNVRVAPLSAREVLETLPPAALDQVFILFPDPWPKQRHLKRRLIQPAFLSLLASRMARRGRLQLATDWEAYARWMVTCLEGSPDFTSLHPGQAYAPQPEEWLETRFQRKGLAAGRGTFHLLYARTPTD